MLQPLIASLHGALQLLLDAPFVFLRMNLLQLVTIAIDLITIMLLLPLLAFHTYLALANYTTWEVLSARNVTYLRNVPSNVNPFSRGILGNLKHFCYELPVAHKKGQRIMYTMPPKEYLEELSEHESIWDNRYYSCFD